MSYRFAQIPELQGQFSLVSTAKFPIIVSQIRKNLESNQHKLDFDISNSTEDQVRNILYRNAPVSIAARVYIIWPADSLAIKLAYAQFAEQYNELWFPSRDDVWITIEPFEWLIEISHEEIMTFFTPDEN